MKGEEEEEDRSSPNCVFKGEVLSINTPQTEFAASEDADVERAEKGVWRMFWRRPESQLVRHVGVSAFLAVVVRVDLPVRSEDWEATARSKERFALRSVLLRHSVERSRRTSRRKRRPRRFSHAHIFW